MLSDKPGTQDNMRTCLHCCLYSTVFFHVHHVIAMYFCGQQNTLTVNFTECVSEMRCINISTANLQPDMATESTHCRLGTTTSYFHPQFRVPTSNDVPGRPGCRLPYTEPLCFKHLQAICR